MRYKSKELLLDDIRTEHDSLCARLAGIPNGRWQESGVWGDGWTLSDLVAHLAEWQQMFLTWYEHGLRGSTPEMPAPGYKWSQTPALNRAIREKHRSRSVAAVRADFDSGYGRIVHIAESLSSEQLLESGHYEWTGKHPLTTYLGPNTASHYRFAIKVIRRWLKGTAGRGSSRAASASGTRRPPASAAGRRISLEAEQRRTTTMSQKKQVLFVHGGGENGYEADRPLATSLRQRLGTDYNVRSPRMPEDTALPDFGWPEKIGDEIAAVPSHLFLVGHSLGASMLLKYLSESPGPSPIRGVFLLATPFWSGEEDWKRGLKLREDFASALPKAFPIFLYQSLDDEEVDISHLAIYEAELPWATVRRLATGGHQFNNDLAFVARDIRSLE